ncbi:MAG: tyrosine-type recombinase/integrase [Lachnospiraceae bacterium]
MMGCSDGKFGFYLSLDFLRHSCASLLLANGVPMKQIQEWLGHSDFSTTANVYAHSCHLLMLWQAA